MQIQSFAGSRISKNAMPDSETERDFASITHPMKQNAATPCPQLFNLTKVLNFVVRPKP